VLGLALASGNLWVYPQKTAMGWDSTLAHLPWYGLLSQVEKHLKTANIPFNQVGTAFPNIGSRKIYELDGTEVGFVEKDFEANCYIFYSNIMNDFSDVEIDELHEQWTPVFRVEKAGVFVILFKNPKIGRCEN
jgi:hypothetical protein